MTDHASLLLFLWLIPVTLQILLPLAMLCVWTVSRIVAPAAQKEARKQVEEPSALPGMTGVAN